MPVEPCAKPPPPFYKEDGGSMVEKKSEKSRKTNRIRNFKMRLCAFSLIRSG